MKDEKLETETQRRGTSALTRLLCCPFCGGKAEYSEPIMIGTAFFTIECKKCGVKTPRYSSKKKLNLFWNRRKNTNDSVSIIKNLRAKWMAERDKKEPPHPWILRKQQGVYALDEAIKTLEAGKVVQYTDEGIERL